MGSVEGQDEALTARWEDAKVLASEDLSREIRKEIERMQGVYGECLP